MVYRIFFSSVTTLFFSFSLLAQTMIPIPAGEFVMGCTEEQKPDCDGDEFPIHAVRLSAYQLGQYEITQAEWEAVMGDNPSKFSDCGGNCPVENIDWYSTLVYCNELTLNDPDLGPDERFYYKDADLQVPWQMSDYNGDGDTSGDEVFLAMDKKGYRLPFEAEWEYAARGAQQTLGYHYSGGDNLDDLGWYDDNSEDMTHPVGQKQPNELDIYDLSGNVWEKVFDYYMEYTDFHQCDPIGPEDGSDRVNRGGAYQYDSKDSIIASRYFNKPTRAVGNIGFRVARYE